MKMFRLNQLGVVGRTVTRSLATKATSAPATTSAPTINKDVDKFQDVKTHTGQTFEENDYRLARFINGRKKLVNPRMAIDLIAEIPPTAVKGRKVSCDGGGGPLGHPRVFINLDQPGNHSCGYCGLRFYQEHDHHH